MKNKLLYIVLLAAVPVWSQTRQAVKGMVVSPEYALSEVLVVNITSEKETKTDGTGTFSIDASEGDTLVITDPRIKPLVHTVKKNDLMHDLVFTVEVQEVQELEEIVIEKDYRLTAEGLGIVPPGQKVYTTAERRLYTAGDFKMIDLLKIIGGGMPLDPLFNAINGRTKQRKMEVEIEKKETALTAVTDLYTEQQIMDEFRMPQEYVKGFLYYCVEDKDFAAALKDKNETSAKFLMSGLSVKYLALITEEENKEDGK